LPLLGAVQATSLLVVLTICFYAPAFSYVKKVTAAISTRNQLALTERKFCHRKKHTHSPAVSKLSISLLNIKVDFSKMSNRAFLAKNLPFFFDFEKTVKKSTKNPKKQLDNALTFSIKIMYNKSTLEESQSLFVKSNK